MKLNKKKAGYGPFLITFYFLKVVSEVSRRSEEKVAKSRRILAPNDVEPTLSGNLKTFKFI